MYPIMQMSGLRLICILTLVLGVAVLLLNIYFEEESSEIPLQPTPIRIIDDFTIATKGCKIPKLDPYHSSVLDYIKDYSGKKLECSKFSMIIAENRTLKVNKKHPLYTKKTTCQYQTITRKNEDHNNLESPIIIDPNNGTVVTTEFVMAECLNEKNTQIYQDFFSFFVRKQEVEERCKKILDSQTKKPLSVLLLGLDSVSKNSYIRHLHLVDKFIREKLTFVELHGYNKLGLNTYPNMVPLYTGKLESEYSFDHTKTNLNELPMAWKEFSEKGYRTLLAEDCAHMSSFNYLKRGFDNQPTDYYMRPFSIEVEKSNMKKKWTQGCFHNRTETSVVYKWLQDFFDAFSPDPLFAHVFLTRLSHDNYNTVAYQDKPIYDLLNYLRDAGHLNRTIVFFFSDHGFRFGSIRTTYVGHLEDKLPYFFFLLPEWFPKAYPEYMKNLKINEKRLVTPLDMHRTMLDIASNLNNVQEPKPSSRSISLFTQIPDTRTCEIAYIEQQYCTCFVRQQISVDDFLAKNATTLLMKAINDMTLVYRNVCVVLDLKRIIEVSVHDVDINAEKKEKYTNYLITFEVNPSGGVFQGIALYNHMTEQFNVDKNIDRINKYGNQSLCISELHIRLYCFCNASINLS